MTEIWRCVDHEITLTVEGTKRTFTTPLGSIRGMPPCHLLTLEPLVEGEVKGFHTCHIEKAVS